jgi:peptidoglycan/LPS O-acetylase OafA/YrhL
MIAPEHAPKVTVLMLLNNIFLLPGGNLFIPAAWTLRHELLFYSLFALLIVNRRLGLVVFAAWTALIILAQMIDGIENEKQNAVWNVISNYLNLYFICGMAIAAANRLGKLRLVIATTSMLFMVALIPHILWDSGFPLPLIQLIFCATFVSVATGLSANQVPAPIGSLWMGALSYALYLVHLRAMWFVRGVFRQTGYHTPDVWPIEVLAAIVLSVATAYAIVLLFERPLLPRLHAIFVRRLHSGGIGTATLPQSVDT